MLGPAEAPLAVVRGRHRFRLLVNRRASFDLQAYLRAWLAAARSATGNIRSRSTSIRRAFCEEEEEM